METLRIERFLILCQLFFLIFIGVHGRDPKIDEPMKELVESFGYPFEVHEVTTEDNYLLGIHRIPVSHNSSDDNGLPPILIMHGLLGASPDWVVTGPNRSLAFLLSDNGYDIWLGNNRGNSYSKEHKILKSGNLKYWDFSWHELGIYDTPAIIDYILKETNHTKLIYIGFSQGCTQFFVMNSLKPEYNDKIITMKALAPAAFTAHMGGLLKPISSLVQLGRFASEWTTYFEFMPHSAMVTKMTDQICKEGSPLQYMCEFIVFMVGGFSEDQEIDKLHYPVYLRYAPAGCSTKQLLHYGMNAQSGKFRQYDYGFFKNLRVYHSLFPPDYDLSKVTTPVSIYNGLNDYLAALYDVAELASRLPNVTSIYTVKLERLNHFDFLYGLHIRNLAYDKLIDEIVSSISN